MEQINSDLKSFLEYCKENHLSNDEIAKICQPLTTSIDRTRKLLFMKCLVIFLLFSVALYYLTYINTVSWNLSAIGRIAMIKILPLYDWRHLKNDRCLVSNFMEALNENSGPSFNCALCEAIDSINVKSQIDPAFLNDHYMLLHKPIILVDALQGWSIFQNPTAPLLIEDQAFRDSIPCKLLTNIHGDSMITTGKILGKVSNFNKYFLHFQNCDFDATKAFRVVAPKPHFLPAETSPVQYSWLVASRNYNTSSYKPIELREPITVMGQIVGSNFVRLIPRRNCETECPLIRIELLRGEALVFTSLWDLEYKPNSTGENIAVILEMH